MSAWVAAKLLVANEFCWTTTNNIIPLIIIQIPIMISVLVSILFCITHKEIQFGLFQINLVLFIKISIVLYTKLQSTFNYEQAQRYQKWAKSTLVLVPLFGIHYSLLVVMYFFVELNEVAEVIYLLSDQLFASSQVITHFSIVTLALYLSN